MKKLLATGVVLSLSIGSLCAMQPGTGFYTVSRARQAGAASALNQPIATLSKASGLQGFNKQQLQARLAQREQEAKKVQAKIADLKKKAKQSPQAKAALERTQKHHKQQLERIAAIKKQIKVAPTPAETQKRLQKYATQSVK